jgi:hypothetical protein
MTMTDAASIVLAQTESMDTTDDGSVDNPTVVSDQESADTVSTGDTTNDTAEGDNSASGDTDADNAVEGGDQSTSSETYADFEMPEGVELDVQLMEQAQPLFKELGLNQEQAQKLVDFQAAQVQASQTGQAEAFNQLKQDWQAQSKSDNEIGGDKFDESVSDAREALGKFGTPELTKLLNDFGVGNHPEMIRFMAKVGNLTKEDVPGNSGSPSTPEKDRVSILYPSDS